MQRRAFHQVVARHREEASLRGAADRVARSPDALQQRRDAVRGANLADEIDVADVDAELERRRRHQRPEPPGFQPGLGVQPLVLRQAAVVRGDRFLAQAIAQVPGEPFGHAARVHENERGPVRLRPAS